MKRLLIIFSCILFVAAGYAQNIDAIIKSKPTTLVNDYADVIPAGEQQILERKLVAYDDSTSTQIAIVVVKTLDGKPIEETALAIYRAWGIGNKKTHNGILILAAIDDRQVRIEVGYGLEGAIPDITANQIIRNDIAPGFRSENYAGGFEKASESLIKAAAGEYKAPAGYRDRKTGRRGGSIIGGIIFIVIMIILSGINRGGGGGFMSRRGYRGVGSTIFWPGAGGGWTGGGGGGGWSDGGGGGFGGFGGGSSGGGGASGSW